MIEGEMETMKTGFAFAFFAWFAVSTAPFRVLRLSSGILLRFCAASRSKTLSPNPSGTVMLQPWPV